jgi:predicted membrane protein
MYTKDDNNATSPSPSPIPPPDDNWRSERSGRVFAGFIIVVVGSLLLARQSGADIPRWLLDWPMILIVVGLFIGVRHRFRSPAWIILVGVGSFFMADHFIDDFSFRQFIWPILIITVGILMIIKPKRKHRDEWKKKWKERYQDKWEKKYSAADISNTDDDRIDTVTIFGSVKKNIISKNFKGGEATCVFGGAEINLGQADINGRADIELTQVFGGAKLIVPADWKIQTNELVCLMGGFEDKRKNLSPTPDPNKVLSIRGTCIFGGIEIKSY